MTLGNAENEAAIEEKEGRIMIRRKRVVSLSFNKSPIQSQTF